MNGMFDLNRYKYISSFRDRHGKVRFRFRRKGYHSVYINGEPGSTDFLREYADAMENKLTVGEDRVVSRSVSDLVVRYLKSSNFQATKQNTQTVYRRILDNFRQDYGDLPVAGLERRHIRQIMDKMEATPTSANRLLSLLGIMLDIALDLEWVKINHARTIKKMKYKKEGFISWSETELARYESFYPSGSRERLAFFLYLYTGQRGSDIYLMNRSQIENGWIAVSQNKTGKSLFIPIHPKLQTELDQHKDKHVLILTKYGKPFSIKGFQQWFVKTARAAGLENRSGHGIRKATASRLADAGCTAHQIQAITGHETLSEIEHYTKAANQKNLATAAMSRID